MTTPNRRDAILRPMVRRLTLSDFRSYASIDIRMGSQLVVLTGENGAGKTNILEAISMFSPGRGLRRAEIAECARRAGAGGFAVSIEVETEAGVTPARPWARARWTRRRRIETLPRGSLPRRFGARVRGSPSRIMVDACDGRLVRGLGRRAATFP